MVAAHRLESPLRLRAVRLGEHQCGLPTLCLCVAGSTGNCPSGSAMTARLSAGVSVAGWLFVTRRGWERGQERPLSALPSVTVGLSSPAGAAGRRGAVRGGRRLSWALQSFSFARSKLLTVSCSARASRITYPCLAHTWLLFLLTSSFQLACLCLPLSYRRVFSPRVFHSRLPSPGNAPPAVRHLPLLSVMFIQGHVHPATPRRHAITGPQTTDPRAWCPQDKVTVPFNGRECQRKLLRV